MALLLFELELESELDSQPAARFEGFLLTDGTNCSPRNNISSSRPGSGESLAELKFVLCIIDRCGRSRIGEIYWPSAGGEISGKACKVLVASWTAPG